MGGNTREPGRTTANRVLAILGAFTCDEPVLTLSRIAAVTAMPLGTVHRLAEELIEWGALERRSDRRLQIGMRLWHTGALAPRHRDLRAVLLPHMQDLYAATHENVQLAVPEGRHALVVEKISGRGSVQTVTAVGGPLPLHATGVGKVVLAYSGPELVASVFAAGLTRHTPNTITLPGVLVEALARTRARSLGFSIEEMTLGASSVAAPILDVDGRLRAALAVVVHSSTDLRTVAAAVRTAALAAGRDLAASPE